MTGTPTRWLLLVAAALCVAPAVRAAEEQPGQEDPWTGKSRSEIVRLLGEPSKSKKSHDGDETLTYKFFRVDPRAPLRPDVVLLHLPGIGLVARILDPATGASDPLEIAPQEYDDQGRPTGGGVWSMRTQSSSSYDPKTGKLTREWAGSENPSVRGKVKVRFFLDASGQVRDWSVSGKK